MTKYLKPQEFLLFLRKEKKRKDNKTKNAVLACPHPIFLDPKK
jgi:hypothetical protein